VVRPLPPAQNKKMCACTRKNLFSKMQYGHQKTQNLMPIESSKKTLAKKLSARK
jgi:hypothetical protein